MKPHSALAYNSPSPSNAAFVTVSIPLDYYNLWTNGEKVKWSAHFMPPVISGRGSIMLRRESDGPVTRNTGHSSACLAGRDKDHVDIRWSAVNVRNFELFTGGHFGKTDALISYREDGTICVTIPPVGECKKEVLRGKKREAEAKNSQHAHAVSAGTPIPQLVTTAPTPVMGEAEHIAALRRALDNVNLWRRALPVTIYVKPDGDVAAKIIREQEL